MSVVPEILGAGVYGLKAACSNSFKIVCLPPLAFGVVGSACATWTTNVGKFTTDRVGVRLDGEEITKS